MKKLSLFFIYLLITICNTAVVDAASVNLVVEMSGGEKLKFEIDDNIHFVIKSNRIAFLSSNSNMEVYSIDDIQKFYYITDTSSIAAMDSSFIWNFVGNTLSLKNLESTGKVSDLKIYSGSGVLKRHYTFTDHALINLDDLTSDIYFFSINDQQVIKISVR